MHMLRRGTSHMWRFMCSWKVWLSVCVFPFHNLLHFLGPSTPPPPPHVDVEYNIDNIRERLRRGVVLTCAQQWPIGAWRIPDRRACHVGKACVLLWIGVLCLCYMYTNLFSLCSQRTRTPMRTPTLKRTMIQCHPHRGGDWLRCLHKVCVCGCKNQFCPFVLSLQVDPNWLLHPPVSRQNITKVWVWFCGFSFCFFTCLRWVALMPLVYFHDCEATHPTMNGNEKEWCKHDIPHEIAILSTKMCTKHKCTQEHASVSTVCISLGTQSSPSTGWRHSLAFRTAKLLTLLYSKSFCIWDRHIILPLPLHFFFVSTGMQM